MVDRTNQLVLERPRQEQPSPLFDARVILPEPVRLSGMQPTYPLVRDALIAAYSQIYQQMSNRFSSYTLEIEGASALTMFLFCAGQMGHHTIICLFCYSQ